ncbi:MAG: YggS family pyridoxal phosphate-dependent enzyme, partial [Alphaproteobacteria bacterium]|nr:YggS family pyridoxal phosphate-dependent enzyme [Alphaproteobacteria bacterium]
MGMSGDYPQALAAGASLIRVGSYLFSPAESPARS